MIMCVITAETATQSGPATRSSAQKTPRPSSADNKDATPRVTSATPRETSVEARDTSVTPRDTSLATRDTSATPRDKAATPRDAKDTLNHNNKITPNDLATRGERTPRDAARPADLPSNKDGGDIRVHKGRMEADINGKRHVFETPDDFELSKVNTDPPQERLKLEWM